MDKIGIFYGSTTGNTQSAAEQIHEKLGSDVSDLINVDSASGDQLDAYKNLILGTSTWGIGDLQDDFQDFLEVLGAHDLKGKKVALFGLGDSSSYGDSFVDGMGEIYETVNAQGAEVIGSVDASTYEFDDSRANVDGKFVGLPLDEDNESHLTEERIENWVKELKSNF